MTTHEGEGQMAFPLDAAVEGSAKKPRRRRASPRLGEDPPAEELPIARVLVDVPVPHLDRAFDYEVPERMSEAAQPGVRVRVRFSGRELEGFVLERRAESDHDGRLQRLHRVVSQDVVLPPHLLELCREVARDHAGSAAEAVRLAVPPRHARAEASVQRAVEAGDLEAREPSRATPSLNEAWSAHPAAAAFAARTAQGEGPGGLVELLPCAGDGLGWAGMLADLARSVVTSCGLPALIVVPDGEAVDSVETALRDDAEGEPLRVVRLTSAQGPQARYTAWLTVLRGGADVVVGTRAAAWAPASRWSLVCWWDDGDDSHEEPHAPYAHARRVCLAQARRCGAGVLAAGWSRSTPVEQLHRDGVLRDLGARPEVLAARRPLVHVAGNDVDAERDAGARGRMPKAAWSVVNRAVQRGPVLVQVPRLGYVPALRCQRCRARAECGRCGGPLQLLSADAHPQCRRCGHQDLFRCGACGGGELRSSVIGTERTAEELGRAFPSVRVIASGGQHIVREVDDKPAVVVATPGAEPEAPHGYAGALLLDAWAMLDRPGLDAGEQALRRWMAVCARLAPGASAVITGVPADPMPAVQALVRWAPGWFAEREVAEREPLGLPPTRVTVTARGSADDVASLAARVADMVDVSTWGPVTEREGRGSGAERHRLTWVGRGSSDTALVRSIAQARAQESAHRRAQGLSLRLNDPRSLG